jgi:processive 1,2-diacylglycerol beta-glucosyltransferase
VSERILVLHASVGAGHTRAAKAVAQALAWEAPAARVEVVDALELARPMFRRAYGDGYLALVERAPALFGMLFDATDRAPSGRAVGERVRRLVQRWGARRLVSLLAGGSWDCVVHTHFLAPELSGALRRAGRFTSPELVVVTDFDAHRIWAGEADAYAVASSLADGSLRAHGVDAARIAVSGIPIDLSFASPVSRAESHALFGLSPDLPVVVAASGGHGIGPVEETARALLACQVPAQFVVVCGRNEEARRRVSGLRPPTRHRLKVLGYTDRMRDLMAGADLLVTKPGGLTVSEALACGLPMALVNPIPGQETRNADFLLEAGAAVKAGSPAALTGKIESLLADSRRLAATRKRAKALGRPDAAFAAARRALELARGRLQRDRAEMMDIALRAKVAAAVPVHKMSPGLQISATSAAETA